MRIEGSYIIRPGNLNIPGIAAFFTGKTPGADKNGISVVSSFPEDKIYFPVQKHTSDVIEFNGNASPAVADAVITRVPGVLVGVQVADCVPILLYGRDSGAVAAVHAGWRGTASGIIKECLRRMGENLESVLVAIGPSVRWCCYEVGEDVLKAVSEQTGPGDYHTKREGRLCLDLPSANKHQAMTLGVPEGNIWMSDECTYCLPERYYSYRRLGASAGRQGGFIGIINT